MAHLARYSTRPGTLATRQMVDDVPEDEKMRRFRLLEDQQEGILSEINAQYLGQTVSVLFEEKVKARWKGRTETNKLVFVESEAELRGQVQGGKNPVGRTLVDDRRSKITCKRGVESPLA